MKDKPYPEPTCTECGCTERKACLDHMDEPCYWVRLNRSTNAGLCSVCDRKGKRQ